MPSIEQASLRIVGIMVAYDQRLDPMAAIANINSSIDHTILIDNTSNGHTALNGIKTDARLTILINQNNGGLAGAYNMAIEEIRSAHIDATHVLFLDDDTDTNAIESFLSSEITTHYAARSDVAAVAPAYVDRETGLRGTHILLKRFTYKILPRILTEPTEVSFLINSMSLWNLEALKRIGPYSSRLKVDHVDTDYCLRSAIDGYKLFLNPTVTFLHSIGKRRKYKFMGRILQSGGHSPARRKMIAFNTLLLAKHYCRRFPSFTILCIARLVYEFLGVIMVESDKLRKLGALVRGTISGIFARYA